MPTASELAIISKVRCGLNKNKNDAFNKAAARVMVATIIARPHSKVKNLLVSLEYKL